MGMESFSVESDDIQNLRERIVVLEQRSYDVRVILLQLAISSDWSDEEINNVIGATAEELKFFRGE